MTADWLLFWGTDLTIKKITVAGQNGFTLLEIIVTLIIMGLISLSATAFLLYGVEGFLMARANTEVYQKASIAMERLVRETKNFDTLFQITSDSMRYQRDNQGFGVALVGDDIMMIRANALPDEDNGSILIDNVNAFSIVFEDVDGNPWAVPVDNSLTGLSKITISMTIAVGGTSRTFSAEVNPFYNDMVNGPTS